MIIRIKQLYSLLLFRFYGWAQNDDLSRQLSYNDEFLSRAVWVYHATLWMNLCALGLIIKLLTDATFYPDGIMGVVYVAIFLIPITSFLVEHKSGMKIIIRMRRELKESSEEENRKGKGVAKPYVISSYVFLAIVGFANISFDNDQDIERTKSTPEYQRMQERSREYQREYEQRMKEQEEEKFRQFLRNTNKWQSGDSAKDSL